MEGDKAEAYADLSSKKAALPFGRAAYVFHNNCRCGEIGRRKGLKIPRWKQRTGSNPVTGTTYIQNLRYSMKSRFTWIFILVSVALLAIFVVYETKLESEQVKTATTVSTTSPEEVLSAKDYNESAFLRIQDRYLRKAVTTQTTTEMTTIHIISYDELTTSVPSTEYIEENISEDDAETSEEYTVEETYLDDAETEEESEIEVEDPWIYSPEYFRRAGRIRWNGWFWTWYSERVLPGPGLRIPGRHTDDLGYVRDEDGYICLASDDLAKHTVVSTPFGSPGKVYDCGCGSGTLDVYVGW